MVIESARVHFETSMNMKMMTKKNATCLENKKHRNALLLIKTCKNCSVFVLMFILGWGATQIVAVMALATGSVSVEIEVIMALLAHFQGTLNPVIYAFQNRTVKKKLKNTTAMLNRISGKKNKINIPAPLSETTRSSTRGSTYGSLVRSSTNEESVGEPVTPNLKEKRKESSLGEASSSTYQTSSCELVLPNQIE